MSDKSKSYGLIIKDNKKGLTKKVPSVFANESSSEDDTRNKKSVNKNITDESTKKMQMKQTKIEMQRALEEDPTVYEYDEVYDQMEENKKEAVITTSQTEKKSKYISKLLKSTETRKLEDERRKERKIQKERDNEGEEFKDKEEFVTSSYRKKIEERAAEEEKIRKQDALDSANDVTKQKDLGMFYQNLLTKNTAMGGDGNTEQYNNVKNNGKRNSAISKQKSKKNSFNKDDDSESESGGVNDKFNKQKSKKRLYRKAIHNPSSDSSDEEKSIPKHKKPKTPVSESSSSEEEQSVKKIPTKSKRTKKDSSSCASDRSPDQQKNKKSEIKKKRKNSSSDDEGFNTNKKADKRTLKNSSYDSDVEEKRNGKSKKQQSLDKNEKENKNKKSKSKSYPSSDDNETNSNKKPMKNNEKAKNVFVRRNTDKDIKAARERYLERKQALEEMVEK